MQKLMSRMSRQQKDDKKADSGKDRAAEADASPDAAKNNKDDESKKKKQQQPKEKEKKKKRKNASPLEEKIDDSLDATLEVTGRILEMVKQIQDTGIDLLVALDVHLEKADKIELMMEKINAAMHDAEQNLEDMQKCCGLFSLPWKSGPNFEKSEAYQEIWLKPPDPADCQNVVEVPAFMMSPGCKNPGPVPETGRFFERVIGDDSREDEIEANLEEISRILVTIREITVDFGAELELQERNFPLIVHKAMSLEERVKIGTETANLILTDEKGA